MDVGLEVEYHRLHVPFSHMGEVAMQWEIQQL